MGKSAIQLLDHNLSLTSSLVLTAALSFGFSPFVNSSLLMAAIISIITHK